MSERVGRLEWFLLCAAAVVWGLLLAHTFVRAVSWAREYFHG